MTLSLFAMLANQWPCDEHVLRIEWLRWIMDLATKSRKYISECFSSRRRNSQHKQELNTAWMSRYRGQCYNRGCSQARGKEAGYGNHYFKTILKLCPCERFSTFLHDKNKQLSSSHEKTALELICSMQLNIALWLAWSFLYTIGPLNNFSCLCTDRKRVHNLAFVKVRLTRHPSLPGTVQVMSPLSHVPVDVSKTIDFSKFCTSVPGVQVFFYHYHVQISFFGQVWAKHKLSNVTEPIKRHRIQSPHYWFVYVIDNIVYNVALFVFSSQTLIVCQFVMWKIWSA